MSPNEIFARVTVEPGAPAALCHRFQVNRLDLFGSTATEGRFDPEHSDLDFLAIFESLTPHEYTEAVLQNPYLRQQVERERRTVFMRP